ncbi:polysaccharide deacetylase family protein [Cohnella abietis]|uniref:NodB homology domain-containing protein n=1 Tax=Cohnella abietis TaxID=2507935 RepID=A0A3T1DE75_9BACL|nr:polysaccharide deacetylase family protein [Cohnella abietis]BBI36393.1 hypothetical protein KCTCHS21_57920 [Cohnella abietis]
MRGKRPKKRRILPYALVLVALALLTSLFTLFQGWSRDGLSGAGVVDAAAPTESSEPAVLTTDKVPPVATPQASKDPGATTTQPPVKEPTSSPVVINKDIYKNKKLVALTFDDGPDNKYTEEILDLLAEYNVKATFFVVGTQVQKFPETAKRIVDEGHSIGNHSWSHKDLSKLSAAALELELDKTQRAIFKATGVTSELVRAPYGALSKTLLDTIHKDNMKHVFWTVDTRDWAGSSVAEMHKNVLANTHKGGIILMHSFGGRKHAIEHTIELLPSIIKDLGAKGYEFVTVDELIISGQSHSSVIK